MRLILYKPEIATNVGAAIRIAGCFGAELEIIEPCGFPLKDRDIKRVAMDYGGLVKPNYHSSWQAFLRSQLRQECRLILLSTKAQKTPYAFKFNSTDMLMVGQESAGVPQDVFAQCDEALRIDMAPQARSLNMAMAAGIVLSAARHHLGYP